MGEDDLWDAQEIWGGRKEGCSWHSVVALGRSLGHWIWRAGREWWGSSVRIPVVFLFCLTGVFSVNVSWCWRLGLGDELGIGRLGKNIFVISWGWSQRGLQ